MEEIIAKKFNMLGNTLNERQRRLWAATETSSLGYGAISAVSRATGISRVTIMRGNAQDQRNERRTAAPV